MSATIGLSDPAARLARCVSSASLVEPALLRRMRLELVKEASVASELEIADWRHVETHNSRGLTFDRTVLAALREELAQSGDWQAALTVVQTCHSRAPTLLRLEEEIVALGLQRRAGKTSKHDFADQVEARLGPVLAAMVEPAQKRLLATWAARTLARLPSQVMSCSAARILSFVSSATLPGVVSLARTLTATEAALARPLLDGEQGAAVYLRWVEDTIELVATTKPDVGRWHLIHIPDADPLFVFVGEEALVLEPGQVARVPAAAGSEVVIGTLGGRAWKLVRGDVSNSIAEIAGGSFPGFGYLVDDGLVITTTEASGPQLKVAFFGIQPTGRQLAESDRITRAAAVSVPTAERMDVSPQPTLRLSLDLREGAAVRFLVRRLPDGDKWLQATVGRYFPQDGLFDLLPNRPLSSRELERICGSPILDDSDRVIGHIRNVPEGEQRILACPTRFVLSTIGKTRTFPPAVTTHTQWLSDDGQQQFILQLLRGLYLSSPGLKTHPSMIVHADYFWGRLWWSPERTESFDGLGSILGRNRQTYDAELVTTWRGFGGERGERPRFGAAIAEGTSRALSIRTAETESAPGLVVRKDAVIAVLTNEPAGDLRWELLRALTFSGTEEVQGEEDSPSELLFRVWRTLPLRCLVKLLDLGREEYEQLQTDSGFERLRYEIEARAWKLDDERSAQAKIILEYLNRNRPVYAS